MRDIATFQAVNRFGLGPRGGTPDDLRDDPRGWVLSQIGPSATPEALSGFPGSDTMLSTLYAAQRAGNGALGRDARRLRRTAFTPEIIARTRHMAATDRPFAERMVMFWSNHFTVSAAKLILAPTVPAYEREAIRPHVFGRFAEMLKAVCRHPAMLVYLDNQNSVGPNSRIGLYRRERGAGDSTLNENLAREILELHTLGVNGGYTQDDVVELAKAITGWTHDAAGGPNRPVPERVGFEFRPGAHEPGPRTILGRVYPEAGVRQGLDALDDLARHPSTALHLATKLVRHFVSDAPPWDAVERVARTFLDSDGDLAQVSLTLAGLDAAWATPLAKAKSHQEFVVSVLRATGSTSAGADDIVTPLREMGQRPHVAPSPAGWGDSAADWITPEAIMRRIEWVRRFSATLPSQLIPERFLDDTIGPVASDSLRREVRRAPSGDFAIALVLASPEFQRR